MGYLEALKAPKETAANIISINGALTNALFDLPHPVGTPDRITCTV